LLRQSSAIRALRPLTSLLGALRTSLGPGDDARFQRQFDGLDATDTAAIDFKISLRRQIHLALWHAMCAGENLEAIEPVIQALGSQLLALDAAMPALGWRLVADTLAHIQIHLLENSGAVGLRSEEHTSELQSRENLVCRLLLEKK